MKYRESYRKWMESPHISSEDKRKLQSMNDDEIYEAFYKNIEFGTAGMRGKMGLGINRINKYTIRMASRALAAILGKGAKAAIAYDTRNGSKEFALESARVLGAYGVNVLLFDRFSPVPLLSYTIREYGCDGGAVITASHNSKEYNGFKTYGSSGVQMAPDMTERISRIIGSMKDPLDIKMCSSDSPMITYIGRKAAEKFEKAVIGCSLLKKGESKKNLRVVYTPLYGSGRDYVKNILKADEFINVKLVEMQCNFNGDFPGLVKPNPELPEVFSEAEKEAEKFDADLIIGTDPDSDRVGVGVRCGKGYKYLTGNQTGALLVDFICRMKKGRRRTLVTTVVTGELGSDIAKKNGCRVLKTLTGSKYVCDRLDMLTDEQFLLGYEESYGYVAGRHVRDKDGVSAAMLICEMAAYLKEYDMTLVDRLSELYEEFGYYADGQDSISYEGSKGADEIERIMEELRYHGAEYFKNTGDISEIIDFKEGEHGLPPSNLMKFVFDNGSWVSARPSGTEPNIKIYYCMKGSDAENAQKRLDTARCEVKRAFECI